MTPEPPPLTTEELTDIFVAHQLEAVAGPPFCSCGEEHPCPTARLLAMLVEETARRLWAERQLRAQRTAPRPDGTRRPAALAGVPRWTQEPHQEMYRRLAMKQLTLPEEPTPLTHLRPPF